MTHSIYHDLEINESINKTFQAITEPEHLINWWPFKCTGTPKENEEYNFFFKSEYNWYGKVIKTEKNKSRRRHDIWTPPPRRLREVLRRELLSCWLIDW